MKGDFFTPTRSFMFAFLLSSLLFNPVQADPLPASEFNSIAGAWVVTSTILPGATCPSGAGQTGTHTYLWLIGVVGAEGVTVSVQGQTGFPKMGGTYDSNGLVLMGLAESPPDAGVYPMASFSLQRQPDGSFTGTRRYHSVTPVPDDPLRPVARLPSETPVHYACSIDYTVTAKKQ